MLRIEVLEVAGPLVQCSIKVERGRHETLMKTATHSGHHSAVLFVEHFFAPAKGLESLFFTLQCVSKQGQDFSATWEMRASLINEFVRATASIRKFSVVNGLPANWTQGPIYIKICARVHASADTTASLSSSDSLNVRYERLMSAMSQKIRLDPSMSPQQSRRTGSRSAASTPSSSIPGTPVLMSGGSQSSLKRSGSRGLAAATAERTSLPPNKVLPVQPVKKAEPLRRSQQDVESSARKLVYEGAPARVVAILAPVGGTVMWQDAVLEVELTHDDDDDDDHQHIDSDGAAYSPEQASLYSEAAADMGGSMYSYAHLEQDAYALPAKPFLESAKEEDHAKSVERVAWNEKEPGKVVFVVSLGTVIGPGMTVCQVDVSPEIQLAAHLTAIDKLNMQVARSTHLNERFQTLSERLVGLLNGAGDQADLLQCCRDLERVVRDFLETARMYGRLIISEMHLPIERKTIRPLSIGGVLGGSKYVVRGVLFKIPVAGMFDQYPDPMHIANKVQGHELKGLSSYFGYFFNRGSVGLVSFPLAAVIDFKGHRITAMTQLPISGSNTLVYGSDDAGHDCRVRNAVPEWSAFIREASMGLNLKPHHVVNGRAQGGEIELASCVDLEGHKGEDNRFYLLDFSRTFPPVFKKQDECEPYDQLWPYYHMMRPEFVKNWNVALCSDSFSNFQSKTTGQRIDEAKVNNDEIRDATEHLKTTVVVDVCNNLFKAHDESFSLRHVFHEAGLNMRYLGLVYAMLVGDMYQRSKQNLYKLVQAEAIMRVAKKRLRQELRKTALDASGEDLESRLLVTGANVLNTFFCHADDLLLWKKRNVFCEKELVNSFNFSSTHAKLVTDAFVKNQDTVVQEGATGDRVSVSFKFAVLERLNDAVGLGLSSSLLNELKSGAGFKRNFQRGTIFTDSDLHFEERVKYLDVVERSRGLSEYLLSEMHADTATEHLLAGYEIVEKALEANPIDPWLSMLMGDICCRMHAVLARTYTQKQQELARGKNRDADVVRMLVLELNVVQLFHDRTIRFYRQACSFANNANPFVKLGTFLVQQDENLDEAEELFVRALEICALHNVSFDEVALTELVHLLEKQGSTELGGRLREKTKSFVNFRDKWRLGDANAEDRPRGGSLGTIMGSNRHKIATEAAASPPVAKKGVITRALESVASRTRPKSRPSSQPGSDFVLSPEGSGVELAGALEDTPSGSFLEATADFGSTDEGELTFLGVLDILKRRGTVTEDNRWSSCEEP